MQLDLMSETSLNEREGMISCSKLKLTRYRSGETFRDEQSCQAAAQM